MRLINYADLTWPEVARLPRDLPLLIPLGQDEYDLERAAAALASSPALCLLPALPYGFPISDDPRSNLAVSPGLWRRVLQGVRKELRSQGFNRTYFLNGHGEAAPTGRPASSAGVWQAPGSLGRGLETLSIPCRRASWPHWPANLAQRVVVISTGHTEQHGHHLPLSTDTLIVEAIASGIESAAPQEVLCLPAWPYGVSTHTREFPGTLNLGGRAFEDFFLAIVDRLITLGARMVYFSNGHGGNHSFLVNVVKLAGERHPSCFIATEWLHTTGPALAQHRESAPGGMGHGGELETSYILHLRPDLVHMERATTEIAFVSTANYTMDWVESGRLIANPPWSDDTVSGIYGDGRLGTSEKGRLWLGTAVDEKLAVLREIRQQQEQRQAQRQRAALAQA